MNKSLQNNKEKALFSDSSSEEEKYTLRAEAILDDKSSRSDPTTRNYLDLRRNKRFEMITGVQMSMTYRTTRYID
jgi:hypothetical protein